MSKRVGGSVGSYLESWVEAQWPITLLFVMALLGSWELMGALGRLPPYILSPSAIAWAVVANVADDRVIPAIASSLRRQLLGFLVGTTLGVFLGLLAGVTRIIEDVTSPVVSLTQPLPKIALLPVLAVWLGFSDTARILIIAVVCFYPSFVNALSGTRGIEPRFLWVARSLGAGRLRVFLEVILPAAAPRMIVGVRISLALSFVMLFATEVIGSRTGIGFLVMDGFLSIRYDIMYTGIVCLGILGFVADRTFLWSARRLTRGQSLEAIT